MTNLLFQPVFFSSIKSPRYSIFKWFVNIGSAESLIQQWFPIYISNENAIYVFHQIFAID